MMVKQHIRPLIGIALLLSLAGTLAAGFGEPDYKLKLDFTNADGVVKGADLNINGVQAGKVENLEVKGKVAAVTVSIDSKFRPIHSGAKALIRSLGLLGHKYVEVIEGKGRGELASGSELTVDSTTSPTDLDQFNAMFDAPTREKIKILTNEGAIALGGRAQTLNDDLRQLRNLAVAAEPVTGILDDHQVALDRGTIAFDTFTQKLVKEDAGIRDFVAHGSSVLSSAGAHTQELAGLVAHGDASFTRLDKALNGNENNLAGFFARGPSGIASGNYQLDAGIPVVKATQPILPALFDLLYNLADASTGIVGSGDPNNPNSGTMSALRSISVVCPVVVNQGPFYNPGDKYSC
jgi:phospholipid/cholesterol/gamma-HCH transport system substrate-binding protein